jgi:mannose-6-phosphate isomerase
LSYLRQLPNRRKTMPETLPVFDLEPQYRDYVWGGSRLRPDQVTAEAWIVHEANRVMSGPYAGRTLAEAAEENGAGLLGELAYERTGTRFPLLIKLLDCAQWLSVQVHPNDEQALTLEGDGQFGKTEAWHILTAEPGAEILCGFKPGTHSDTVYQSVRDGTILNHAQRVPMQTGDTIFIPAGTVHALGPGLLVYEVQQTSDITYRVFDWNRPASAGRKLHIEQSLAVLNPSASEQPIHQPEFVDGRQVSLVQCPYFSLNLLTVEHETLALSTGLSTFHTLTPIEGRVKITGKSWEVEKGLFETVLIPANAGAYSITPIGRAQVLKSSVESF